MSTRWATGFMAGALAAIALFEIGTLGLILSLVVALLLLKARGLPALAGMLCGTGVIGLAVLAQANARCATSAGCSAPDITGAVVIAAALLVLGVALTLTHYVQARASRVRV